MLFAFNYKMPDLSYSTNQESLSPLPSNVLTYLCGHEKRACKPGAIFLTSRKFA
jgi:hypothetical protein